MLDSLVSYAIWVSELSKDNPLIHSVVFKKDSWHTEYVNPQTIDELLEMCLIKLFE